VLAENICNSDTLNFNARDLVEPKFSPTGASAGGSMGSLAMTRTGTGHLAATGGGQSFSHDGKGGLGGRPGDTVLRGHQANADLTMAGAKIR